MSARRVPGWKRTGSVWANSAGLSSRVRGGALLASPHRRTRPGSLRLFSLFNATALSYGPPMRELRLSARLMDVSKERSEILGWLCSETWPHHSNEHLSPQQAGELIDRHFSPASDAIEFWIVEDGVDHVGMVRIFDLDDVDDGTPLIDLRVRASKRNIGIGTWAVRWLTNYAFTNWPNLNRLGGTTRSDNIAMRKVFRHCLYLKEGRFRQGWPGSDGHIHDTLFYSILRRDWATGTITPVQWDDEP